MSELVVRARAALEGVPELMVYADHVCAQVDKCTCDGPHDGFGHRPACGLVPIAGIADGLLVFAADARSLVPELADRVEALEAEVEQLRSVNDELVGDLVSGEIKAARAERRASDSCVEPEPSQVGGTRTVVYLHDSQERLTLVASHPGHTAEARHWVESRAFEKLASGALEPDSESQVVTARVVELVEVGDFVMRGPTP